MWDNLTLENVISGNRTDDPVISDRWKTPAALHVPQNYYNDKCNPHNTFFIFFFYLRPILCASAVSVLPALLNFSLLTNTDNKNLLGPWMVFVSLASIAGVLWKINKQINKYSFNSTTNIKPLMILNILTLSCSKTCRFYFHLFCLN